MATGKFKEGAAWVSTSTGMPFIWIKPLGLWVGQYEVTNGEYNRMEPSHDSRDHMGKTLRGDRRPVVFVNFEEARAYAAWLTEKDHADGKLPKAYAYRLPTEKEWQAFAECGDGRAYPWGNEWPPVSGQAGNYDDETTFDSACVDGGFSDGAVVTCEVESSWKNPWGLYGVGGNVWEVTAADATGAAFGAWRGASWFVSAPDAQRCAYRQGGGEIERRSDYGFRLVLAKAAK